MTTLREAAQQALEALEHQMNYWSPSGLATVVSTLRDALADQSEQALEMVEPVAWMYEGEKHFNGGDCCDAKNWFFRWEYTEDRRYAEFMSGTLKQPIPLYTTPPQRKPLTDERVSKLMVGIWGCASIAPQSAPAFARSIERAHGIGGEE